MQQSFKKPGAKALGVCMFLLISLTTWAQNKIEIDTKEAGSWFEHNWMWVAAGVILLIVISLFSRSRNTNSNRGDIRQTTTIIKDAHGNTKSVTTSEENLDI